MGLSSVLRDIESVLSQQVLTNLQRKALASLLECRNNLAALGKGVNCWFSCTGFTSAT
jgi:hypothetical protein